jgi:tight adherence protein B
MTTLFLSIGIFFIFGVIVSIFILVQEEKKKKRMMSVLMGNSVQDVDKSKTNLQNQRRSDLAKKLKEDEKVKDSKKGPSLNDKIQQAGLSISTKQFWMYSIVSCIVLTGLAKVLGAAPFVIIMASITGLLGIPRLVLSKKAASRQKKFMNEFADALESMMRLLKAGMPVSEAIKMVAREFTGPMGEEMERIFDQQKIGIPLPEAVLNASKRMPLTEMKMFATAIAIQTQTGSSLSEVLQNLASVIRARFRLRRKVQALSSEAKASAMIIGALPILVATGLYFVNPEYIILLFTHSTGKFLLGCAAGWMMLGVLVMRQMINFKV